MSMYFFFEKLLFTNSRVVYLNDFSVIAGSFLNILVYCVRETNTKYANEKLNNLHIDI